ncbi:MAG: M48 family metallopeptidase [Algiphilus sp.]|uniref:M48 family metallopeptidase n=1 Tax=Algiphilus sp. TaxID=1872431 RepID=UPI0032F048DE
MSGILHRSLRLLLCLALPLTLAGCQETPTGRSQLALVPDATMTELGRSAFTQMQQQGQVLHAGPAAERVQCISRQITQAVQEVYGPVPQPAQWAVAVFDDPEPNAFALPGGYIGVHSGLLQVADNDAQIAAVIGHEVGHVLARHGNERMTQKLGIRIGLVLFGLLSDVESEQFLRMLGLGAQVGIALPFSRHHEREADLMGLHLMTAAGYAPEESAAFWRNMAALGGEQPPALLSTHPNHEDRIAQLSAQIAAVRSRYGRCSAPPCTAAP